MKADFVDLLWLFRPPKENNTEFLPLGAFTWNTPQPPPKNIIGLTLHEAGLLYKYAKEQWKKLPKDDAGNIILEIGRYWGGTTVLLAHATHDSNVKVVSVDIVEGCLNSETENWLNTYEERKRLNIRVDNSQAMDNLPLSMIFVDGDHTYEGFKNDILHHWNYLNGPCLCHDYNHPHLPGVTTFVTEFINAGYAEIIECVDNLVVLKKIKDYNRKL
mgnify:FL=1